MSKDHLHKLIDDMPEALVGQVLDFAEFISKRAREAQTAALKAYLETLPEDDEELSDETRRRLEEAEAEADRGETISLVEMKRELGLL